MCRLLEAVVQQRANFEEPVQHHELEQEPRNMEQKEINKYSGYVDESCTTQQSATGSTKRVTLMPSSLMDISATQTPTDLGPGLPIKEGLVEKKGHSVAFLMWPK